jgi:ubiquinone/menaquinone biosynthesis C-methylase UbiE
MDRTERPDYANWIPQKLLILAWAGALLPCTLLIIGVVLARGFAATFPNVLLLVYCLLILSYCVYMTPANRMLSYRGGGVQGRILDNVLDHLKWDGNGRLLDIGCGSGAMTIKAAGRFPAARCVGVDLWGPKWDYAQDQCVRNARLEGVAERTDFLRGNAAHMDFPDAAFDAAVSNLVFHEVRSQPDKLKLIREALRVLKPGAPFAFGDVYLSRTVYPDLDGMLRALAADVTEIRYVDMRSSKLVPRYLKTPLVIGSLGLICGRK